MKTFKLITVSAAALSLSLLLAACGAPSETPVATPVVTPAAESPAATPAPADESSLFTPGTWLSDKGQYYFFDEDGTSGRTESLKDGTGVAFEYSLSGSSAEFNLGGEGDALGCSVSQEGGVITLDWADGDTEKLKFVSPLGSDEFEFYTDDELASLALEYYKAHSGEDTDGLVSAAETNADGSVTVQVYRNLGDHNSTSEWYTLDRLTASGTDSAGNPVELA